MPDTSPIAEPYRPGYNPAFLARVWAKQRESKARNRTIAAETEASERAKATSSVVIRPRVLTWIGATRVPSIAELRLQKIAALTERSVGRPGHWLDVVDAVLWWHPGVVPDDVKGTSRKKQISAARMDAIVAVRGNCRKQGKVLTLVETGRLFNRDHTTILHSLRKTKTPGAAR